MSVAATTAPDAAPLGRTRITTKALSRIVSAITAEALGSDPEHVGVDLADSDGVLTLTVTTAIRVACLDVVQADKSVVQRSGGSVMDRTAHAQEIIRDQVNALTGFSIGRVTTRVSGVIIQPEERVK